VLRKSVYMAPGVDNVEGATRVVQILEEEDAALNLQWRLRIEPAQVRGLTPSASTRVTGVT
jgi:hypothetical protein